MLKFILSFVAVVGLSAQVLATEVQIVPNDQAEEEMSKPWVISFDGKTEANVKIVEKILACNDKFSAENKEHLEDLLAHKGGVEHLRERFKSMKRTPASTEQITLSNRELNGMFVETTLKDCLSK